MKTDSNLARLDHHQGHPDHWTSQVVDHFNHQGKRLKVFVMWISNFILRKSQLFWNSKILLFFWELNLSFTMSSFCPGVYVLLMSVLSTVLSIIGFVFYRFFFVSRFVLRELWTTDKRPTRIETGTEFNQSKAKNLNNRLDTNLIKKERFFLEMHYPLVTLHDSL